MRDSLHQLLVVSSCIVGAQLQAGGQCRDFIGSDRATVVATGALGKQSIRPTKDFQLHDGVFTAQ